MTINKSMQLSCQLNDMLNNKDLLPLFYEQFPFNIKGLSNSKSTRDRIFDPQSTLLSMISSMTQKDKSNQNALNIHNTIRNKQVNLLISKEQELKSIDESQPKRGRGRPKKKYLSIPKSKFTKASDNTSAYCQARTRLNAEYVKEVFKMSAITDSSKSVRKFHGQEVYVTDGTYLQLQDTKSIKDVFGNYSKNGYPRGLLSIVIQLGTGTVTNFTLGPDTKSELEFLCNMIQDMKPGSLLLADDLYNCFAVFSLLKSRQIDIIVPGKRVRKYNVMNKVGHGDEIVKIFDSDGKGKMTQIFDVKDKELILRRIEINNPANQAHKIVFYTSLIDRKIKKEEITMQYFTRWDIETSIREIKTMMDMNVVRGKSPDMVQKEVTTGLIAYNYIRKSIQEIAEEGDFSPEEDIFRKLYSPSTPIHIDKLGRVYYRWSSGRPKYAENENSATHNTVSTE